MSFTCLVKRRVVASENPCGFLSPTTWRPGSGGGEGNRRSLLPDECRRLRAGARGARRGAGGNEPCRERRAACGACLPAEGSGREQGFHHWPSALKAFEIGALADVAALGLACDGRGGGGVVSPGETLHIVIRLRPIFGGRREESCEP
jgi:hypothetical protein